MVSGFTATGTGAVAAEVRERRVSSASQVIVLTLPKGETVVTTPRQLFLTKPGTFVRAHDLKVGDYLKTAGKQPVKVMGVLRKSETTIVHELRLNGAASYRVGLAGIITNIIKNETPEVEEIPEAKMPSPREKRPEIGPKPPKKTS